MFIFVVLGPRLLNCSLKCVDDIRFILWGHWYPVFPWLQNQRNPLTCMFRHLYAMHFSDWPPVRHLLTSLLLNVIIFLVNLIFFHNLAEMFSFFVTDLWFAFHSSPHWGGYFVLMDHWMFPHFVVNYLNMEYVHGVFKTKKSSLQ